MPSHRSSTVAANGAENSLQDFVRGERGRALRAQLAARHKDCSAVEIEDAIQTACERFLRQAEGISDPGQVYSWIRTTAHRLLNRDTDRHIHELQIGVSGFRLEGIPAEDDGPEEELVSTEDDADLAELVEEVCSSLPDRGRDILALYGAGYKRPEIAERLGLSDRVVKRELLEVMDAARSTLARLVGGGCQHGESLVLRSVCGLATGPEDAHAREHLARCSRCELFSERLLAWREKAGAILPVPAAEEASPGLVERALHKSADSLSSIKQHVLDGGTQVKQHVTSTYYRAVDPTPLAAARPGTAAAVIASCIAIGGGAATYCAEKGVDPLGAAKGLVAAAPETKPEETTPPEPEAEAPTPVYTPEPPAAEEPAPAPEPEPQPAPQPEPKPEPQPEPPPPEDSFEPVSPGYASTSEGGSEETYEAPEAAPVESTQPEPAPAQPGPQFGGP